MVKVAINGFGRIGRCLFRFLWEMPDVGGCHVHSIRNPKCSCNNGKLDVFVVAKLGEVEMI